MIYRIKEGQDNNILFYDVTVKDFSYLMNGNYNIIIKEMIIESQLLKMINFPNRIINLIVDTIVNNKDISYLKDELTKNNVPLYSLIINLVDTYRKKYKRLLELRDVVEIEIECTKDNFIKGLELAKKINKKVIINGRTITFSEYYDLLSNYDIDLLIDLDVKVDYQEQNSEIGIRELYETAIMIRNISEEIKKYNLSPLEEIICVYDRVKARVYKESDESKLKSRDLDKVLKNKTIVCVGFSNLFNAILKNLGINAMPLISRQKRHQRSLVYVHDDKYNIDGVYVFDPTNDSRRSDNYIDNYKYFGLKLNDSEIEHPTIMSEYIKFLFGDMLKLVEYKDQKELLKNMGIINDFETLFRFVNIESFKEFDKLISNYNYAPVHEKVKALKIYRNFIDKFNSKEISVSTFMLAVYNTRIIEYYSGLIDDVDIEDVIDASTIRAVFQKFNYEEGERTVMKSLDAIDYELEIYDVLEKEISDNDIDEKRDKLRVKLLKVLRNGQKKRVN